MGREFLPTVSSYHGFTPRFAQVSRLFRAISRAVSRFFASFADGLGFHKICGCFARVSRVIHVSIRVMVSSTLRPMVEE
eukprot:3994086-Prymnesium_polylepis.1